MLITTDQLKKFTQAGYETDEVSTSLLEIYIGTAQNIIKKYVGFDVENAETGISPVPAEFKLVCLEISALILQEEGMNLGINSKSFAESGSRTFLNITDYSKYLQRLSDYRRGDTLEM